MRESKLSVAVQSIEIQLLLLALALLILTWPLISQQQFSHLGIFTFLFLSWAILPIYQLLLNRSDSKGDSGQETE